MADTTFDLPEYSVYIKNGILYNKYKHEVNIQNALNIEKDSMELIKENSIGMIPNITIVTDVQESSLKLHMKDYSKAFAGFNLIRHLSGIWMVGAKGNIKKAAEVISKSFFLNRINFVDNLEEAEKGARELINATDSLLEMEEK